MRLLVAFGITMLMLSVSATAGGLSLSRLASVALASSGTVTFSPATSSPAWNGDQFNVEIVAQDVVVTTQCLTDPEDPSSPTASCGLGAFSIEVSWDPALLSYISIAQGPFLASTGRTVNCLTPTVSTGSVLFQCVTLGPVPLGPEGSGTLAILTLDPNGTAPGSSTPLNLTSVQLTDIKANAFPATSVDGQVAFGPCMDVNEPADGTVDLLDALAILGHFGESVPPADPKYDPTGEGQIDLLDALYALGQFGQSCTRI